MNSQSIHQIRRTVKSTQAIVFPTNKDHSAYGQEVVCRPLDTQPDRNKASEYAIVSYRIQSDNLRWDRGSGASAAPSPVSRPVVIHQPPEPALLIEHRDEVGVCLCCGAGSFWWLVCCLFV